MSMQMTDTVVDRVERVKHSIDGHGGVRVTVDGPCANPRCDARVVADVRPESDSVVCASCGSTFAI